MPTQDHHPKDQQAPGAKARGNRFSRRNDESWQDEPYFSLADNMSVNLMVTEKGVPWLVLNKRMPSPIQWAEYDQDMKKLCIVMHNGQIGDFGLKIQPAIAELLEESDQIMLIYMESRKIAGMEHYRLVNRKTDMAQ